MENKNPSTRFLTSTRNHFSKKWQWMPCNYELKREEKGVEIYWCLTPIIQLVNPESKVTSSFFLMKINYNIFLTIDLLFNYSLIFFKENFDLYRKKLLLFIY